MASTRRSPGRAGSATTTDGGVTPPDRMAAIPAGLQSRKWCQPFPIGRASPASGATTSRPKPPSLRHRATADPSGAQAQDRCPAPQVGSACSNGSSSSGRVPLPSGSLTQTFIQPVSSLT